MAPARAMANRLSSLNARFASARAAACLSVLTLTLTLTLTLLHQTRDATFRFFCRRRTSNALYAHASASPNITFVALSVHFHTFIPRYITRSRAMDLRLQPHVPPNARRILEMAHPLEMKAECARVVTPKYNLKSLVQRGITAMLLVGESTHVQMAASANCFFRGTLHHYDHVLSLNTSRSDVWSSALKPAGYRPGRTEVGATQLRTPSFTFTFWFALVYSTTEVVCIFCLSRRGLEFLLRAFGGAGAIAFVNPPGLHDHTEHEYEATAYTMTMALRGSGSYMVDSAPQYFRTTDGSGLYERRVGTGTPCRAPSNLSAASWRTAILTRVWELHGGPRVQLLLTSRDQIAHVSPQMLDMMTKSGDCTHMPRSFAAWAPLMRQWANSTVPSRTRD